MSKMSKFINNPKLFFKDMILKKIGVKPQVKSQVKKVESKPQVKSQVKKVESKSQVKQNLDLLLSENINIFHDYKVVLYTGEKDNSLAHIKIWYPYFVQSGVEFIILCRFYEAYLDILKEYPDAHLVYTNDKKDLDNIFTTFTNLKASFYMSNTGNIVHMLSNFNIKHIFIGHGDSDKTASAHKYFRVYDENWTAGQAHIDRFTNAGFKQNGLKHKKVGRPTLKDALQLSAKTWETRFEEKFNLLYLPTWEGVYIEQDYSSLSIIEECFESLEGIENLNLSVKLHPFTGKRSFEFTGLENRLKKKEFINVVKKEEVLEEYIKKSNIFICDISAVVSECLALNSPIFLYIPKDKEIKISSSNMLYEEYCYIFSSPEELLEKVIDVLTGNDYLKENRGKAMDYIVGVQETLNDGFIKNLINIAKEDEK